MHKNIIKYRKLCVTPTNEKDIFLSKAMDYIYKNWPMQVLYKMKLESLSKSSATEKLSERIIIKLEINR